MNAPSRTTRLRNIALLATVASLATVVVWGREPVQRDPRVRPTTFESRDNAPVRLPAAPRATYTPGLEDCEAYPLPPELQGIDLARQTPDEAHEKSWGCIQCHENTGDPHSKRTVKLGCIDCHGGDPMATSKAAAHVLPLFPDAWVTSGNPVRSYTLLNHERPEFVRFVNPGDLRIAHLSCGTTNCHPKETLATRKSMMTHGAMLWGAALYNNGSVPHKWPRYGESYSMNGASQRLQTVPPPTEYEMKYKGVLPFLDPLPKFEMTQPGNILRIFERGEANYEPTLRSLARRGDADLERVEYLAHEGKLRPEQVGSLCPPGLVLGVELVPVGAPAGRVERDRDQVGLFVGEHFGEHRREAVHGIGDGAVLRGEIGRQRKERPVRQGETVEQQELRHRWHRTLGVRRRYSFRV